VAGAGMSAICTAQHSVSDQFIIVMPLDLHVSSELQCS